MNRTDSVYVVGDTLINGQVHTIYKGSYFGGGNQTNMLTDSAGYVLDAGYKLFSYTNFNVPYNHRCDVNFFCSDDVSINNSVKKIVPAGSFDAIEVQRKFYMPDSSMFSVCDSVWTTHHFFDKNFGFELSSQTSFMSRVRTECLFFERRLVRFFIAP